MSVADVAAEMAARMARLRQARKPPDGPAPKPPASGPAAQSPPAPSGKPAATEPARADWAPRLAEPNLVMITRIDRALRLAAQPRPHPSLQDPGRTRGRLAQQSSSAAFRMLLEEGPNRNAIDMRPERPAGEAPPVGMPAPWAGWSRPPQPALERRVLAAGQRARAFGSVVRTAVIMRRQALRPALEHSMTSAERGASAIAAAACKLAIAAWRSQRHFHTRLMAAWRDLVPRLQSYIGAAQRGILARVAAARRLSSVAWRASAATLARLADRASQRIRALGVAARSLGIAAWQAPASRIVMAGMTVIAVTVAAWCLLLPHGMVPPDMAGMPAVPVPHEIAGAPVIDSPPPPASAPAPIQPPFAVTPRAEAPAAPEAREAEETVGSLRPMLKPPPPLPTLTAHLKPAQKTAAPARQGQPEPGPLEGRPLPPLPGAKPSPTTPDELRRRDDPRGFDTMVDQMFGGRAGRTAPQAGALGRTVSGWLRFWPVLNDWIARPDDAGDPVDPARDVEETR